MNKVAYVNLTREAADFVVANAPPGSKVEVEQQDDGLWAVSIESPDEPIAIDGLRAAPLVPALRRGEEHELGWLSARYESNGNPAAIGHDRTGGWSYGSYQIATKTGTMKRFLEFLKTSLSHAHEELAAAGGDTAASAGDKAFQAAWQKLCADPDFVRAQHAFVKSTHYDPLAEALRKTLALDVAHRSWQLKDVVWSVSVQHGTGGGSRMFKKALRDRKVAELDDKEIINLLYDERSKVDVYFSSSSPKIKQAVLNRFTQERQQALG